MFSVWDRIEENVFADDVTKALARIFPNDPPRFLARTPHGYHDTARIRRELEDAGFSRVRGSRREPSRAALPRRVFQLSPIVRERLFATKSRTEKREVSTLRPTTSRPRLLTDTAAARLPPKFRRT